MDELTRRDALKLLAAAGAGVAAGCRPSSEIPMNSNQQSDAAKAILGLEPLGFQWKTPDPFLFCVHHDDAYPLGNEEMGPKASLAGRDLGQDFAGKDGWRMYHGQKVPGFPQHPHRGFETVTVVRRGLLDHSDSLGATARYGGGDVQWLTAGRGILHAEMFPLVHTDQPNPVELFQIWVNLPSTNKLVDPHFTMFWADRIPRQTVKDERGRATDVTVIAGHYGDKRALAPPPKSWASQEGSDFAIWTLRLDPGAKWTLPAAAKGTNRTLYFFKGSALGVGSRTVPAKQAITLRAEVEVPLENGPDEAELLLLQGRPIAEPVVQYGPFVMNSPEQIRQTFAEYQRTQFGGWPWHRDDPVHPREEGRFAKHADGRVEKPA